MNGMAGYDILSDTEGVTTWEGLFQDLGWDADFEGEYDSPEMYQFLEDNPWLQWGATEEEWLDPEGDIAWNEGEDTFGAPHYWLYEELEDDSPYTDLEDILYDLYGDEVDEIYEAIFSPQGLDPGTADSVYEMYLDPYFTYDRDTGEFVTEYDPVEYELEERETLQLGQDRITKDLEKAMIQYRQERRGLGDYDLDISDMTQLVGGDVSQLEQQYGAGIRASETAYLDDLYGALAEMAGESNIFTDIDL